MKGLFACVLVVVLLFPSFFVGSVSASEPWWDESFDFRIALDLPFVLDESVVGQPVDVRLCFDELCWGFDVLNHSVRVVLQSNDGCLELESQLYDGVFRSDESISECSLVFLIPDGVSSSDVVFVYYDDEQKSMVSYPDRVSVGEGRYRYEPVPGYSIESNHYEFRQGDELCYVVAFGGQVLGSGLTLQMTKMQPEVSSFSLKDMESALGSDFWLYPAGAGEPGSDVSTYQKLVSRRVLVDGNLMCAVELCSESFDGSMSSTVRYRYYYSKDEQFRMVFDARHVVSEQIVVDEFSNFDGVWLSLQMGGVRSQSIEELNGGELLPFIHVASEDGRVLEWDVDPHPRFSGDQWDNRVIDTRDDVDLGGELFVCFDEGISGVVHGVVLNSSSVVMSGNGEADGLQVRGYETGYPNLPGLENQVAGLQVGRNSFETGGSHDNVIPAGFVVQCSGEFFSSYAGGLLSMEQEADLFQSRDVLRPRFGGEVSGGSDEEVFVFDVEVLVPWVSSFPLGSVASAVSGWNLSYVMVELYSLDGVRIAGDVARRLSFFDLSSVLSEESLLGIVRAAVLGIDWRNFSFFKSAVFSGVSEGEYVVKVFRMNPLGGGGSDFIGYERVVVDEDLRLSVSCGREGFVGVGCFDSGRGVGGCVLRLVDEEDTLVDSMVVSGDGAGMIFAPSRVGSSYSVQAWYDGVLVDEKDVGFGRGPLVLRENVVFEIPLGDVEASFVDFWGVGFEGDLNSVVLRHSDSGIVSSISPEIFDDSVFWGGVLVGEYELCFVSGSEVVVLGSVVVSDDGVVLLKDVVIDESFVVDFSVVDVFGFPCSGVVVVSRVGFDESVSVELSSLGMGRVSLPPGEYCFESMVDGSVVGRIFSSVSRDRCLDLVVDVGLWWSVVHVALLSVFAFACVVVFLKRWVDVWGLVRLGGLGLVFGGLGLPFWLVSGSSLGVLYDLRLWLLPRVGLVSLIRQGEVLGGEVLFLPDLAVVALLVVVVGIGVSAVALVCFVFCERLFSKKVGLWGGIVGMLLLVISLMVFVVVLGMVLSVGVGSVFGSGGLEVVVPGSGGVVEVMSSWSLGFGFWLCVVGVVVFCVGLLGRLGFLSRFLGKGFM